MKKVRWVSILLLMAVLLFLLGCSQPKVQTPTQYVPRYTADQVITVVRAQYPVCFKTERVGQDARTVDTPTQISVQFVGGTSHAWKATITCPLGYRMRVVAGTTTIWLVYFWESDGSLHSSLQ